MILKNNNHKLEKKRKEKDKSKHTSRIKDKNKMVFGMKLAIVSIVVCLMIAAITATEPDGQIKVRRSLSNFGQGCCNVFIHTCCFPKHLR